MDTDRAGVDHRETMRNFYTKPACRPNGAMTVAQFPVLPSAPPCFPSPGNRGRVRAYVSMYIYIYISCACEGVSSVPPAARRGSPTRGCHVCSPSTYTGKSHRLHSGQRAHGPVLSAHQSRAARARFMICSINA